MVRERIFSKVFILTILLLAFSLSVTAQKDDKPDGAKIAGKIIDATTGQPIGYASVSIAQQSDGKEINGTTTDDQGAFNLTGVQDGTYKLLIYSVNYVTDTINNIIVSKGKTNTTLGSIKLKSTSTALKEVQITADKSYIENKIDKMVYNVDKDITSQTGVATDALKKIPEVDVDVDGNVELQGNSNIRFLINGKPSSIFGNNIADVLQSIPASQIQSIEVITSPGAKYDAEGTGGIINIILKKSTAQGINGSVSLTGGTRLENGSFNLNARKGHFGAHTFFSTNDQLASTALTSTNRTGQDTGSTTSQLLENGSGTFIRQSYQTGGGFDWDITPHNSISGSVSYFYYGINGTGVTNRENILFDNNDNKLFDSTDILNSTSGFHSHTLDWSLDYKKTFDKDGQELDISYNSSLGYNFSNYSQSQEELAAEAITSGSYGINPDMERETYFSIDYGYPVNDSLSFEVGAKTSFYNVASNSDVYLLNTETDNYDYSTTQSNSLSYGNIVYAAYASVNFRMFRWLDVKMGYRDEYTTTNAYFSGAGTVYIPSYNTPVPSIMIAHKLANKQMLKLSYSHRIERPDYGDLNPFLNASDPQNISTGNPFLKPEIGNKIEFGYNKTFDKGSNLFITMFYRGSLDDLQTYTTFYPTFKVGDSTYNNVSVTQRSNIGTENNYGISVYGSVPVSQKITLRGNLSGFERYINTGFATGGNVHGFNYRTNVNFTYELSSSFTIEAFGNFNSPRINAQGTVPSFTTYSLALRKQLFHKNGSIAITAVNAFNKYVNQTTTLVGDNFDVVSTRLVPYQSFGFNFTYKFGKLEFKDDKQPEDQGMNQQGGN